jgi:lipopolysaccharide export system permease protein
MIFRRALLRELMTNGAYVFVVLVAILVTQFLVKLIGAASTGSLPTEGLLPLVGFRLISQLPPLIVIAMFVAILLSLSRSWRDSEMAIWMSSGQSLLSWVRPVMYFALPCLIVATVLSTALSPWAERRSAEYRKILEARDELSLLAPGLFQEMRRNRQVFYVEGVDLLNGRIKNVFVFADDATQPSITRADQGFIYTDERGDRYVVLQDGRRVKRLGTAAAPGTPPNLNEYEFAQFERYGVRMNATEVKDDPTEERATDTLTLLDKGTPSGMSWVFYRLSVPLAGLFLALLAIPMAYTNPRLGRSINLIIAILLLMTTLNVMNIAQTRISDGKLSFTMAMIVFHSALAALVAVVFYRRYRGTVFVWPWQRAAR